MAETTHRYWQWSKDGDRYFLSGADGAEPIAELERLVVSEADFEADLDLICAATEAWFNKRIIPERTPTDE